MSVTDATRLPGVWFEPAPPPPAEVLPRMDIAAFVGFAVRGPLDTPVPVEDMARFRQIFGAEAPMAWDADRGELVTGHLYAAVHAFFRNGGRRCWIVRVASRRATEARFPIPGLLRFDAGDGRDSSTRLTPARFRASSKGSWSEGYVAAASVAAAELTVRGPGVVRMAPAEPVTAGTRRSMVYELPVTSSAGLDLVPGDVLRLRLVDERIAYLPVVSVEHEREGDRVTVRATRGAWFRRMSPEPGTRCGVAYTDAAGRPRAAHAAVEREALWPASGGIAVLIDALPGAWPGPGSWVRLRIDGRTWWLVVDDAQAVKVSDDVDEQVLVTGETVVRTRPQRAAFRRSFRPRAMRATPGGVRRPGVDVLRLTVWSGADQRLDAARGGLGLGPGHPTFVGELPDDEHLFGGDPSYPWTRRAERTALIDGTSFALAGTDDPGFFVPLFLTDVPRWTSGPLPGGAGSGDRDGLVTAMPSDFLDPDLSVSRPTDLLAQADFLRYQSPVPRRLRGIHSVLDVDEVSLIAVPDAAQPRWTDVSEVMVPGPRPDAAMDSDDEGCLTFELCDPGAPAVPEPRIERDRHDRRSFTVLWPPVDRARAYRVEVRREPESWQQPVVLPRQEPLHRVVRALPGGYRFRVRSEGDHGESDWSAPVRITVDTTPRHEVGARDDVRGSLHTHVALLRLCAARGDLFAVLSLPETISPTGVLGHAEEVRRIVTDARDARRSSLLSPDLDPLGILSFGALYHPWLHTLSDDPTRASPDAVLARSPSASSQSRSRVSAAPATVPRSRPPDGAMVGVFAQRALARGAWVAPANVAVRDVVALVRPPDHADLLRLHAEGVNTLRQLPGGFICLAAQTLSMDPLLREVNVRRLLSLLRRLAIRHGAEYVFEPNSNAFRRRIQRGFEAILATLFERGAFAGSRASDAYRVRVGDPPNSTVSLDAGRLVVELQVAPSVPLEFLTVRLVRSGERFSIEAA